MTEADRPNAEHATSATTAPPRDADRAAPSAPTIRCPR